MYLLKDILILFLWKQIDNVPIGRYPYLLIYSTICHRKTSVMIVCYNLELYWLYMHCLNCFSL